MGAHISGIREWEFSNSYVGVCSDMDAMFDLKMTLAKHSQQTATIFNLLQPYKEPGTEPKDEKNKNTRLPKTINKWNMCPKQNNDRYAFGNNCRNAKLWEIFSSLAEETFLRWQRKYKAKNLGFATIMSTKKSKDQTRSFRSYYCIDAGWFLKYSHNPLLRPTKSLILNLISFANHNRKFIFW